MKVIPGGKQLSLIRDSEEVLKFFEFSAQACASIRVNLDTRRRACQICFSLISEEEDNLKWMINNLAQIFSRASSLGQDDLDIYLKAVKSTLLDFQEWSANPFEWERNRNIEIQNGLSGTSSDASASKKRTLTFPIRSDACVEVILPAGGLSVEDYLKLGLFILPYCHDLKVTKPLPWSGPLDDL